MKEMSQSNHQRGLFTVKAKLLSPFRSPHRHCYLIPTTPVARRQAPNSGILQKSRLRLVAAQAAFTVPSFKSFLPSFLVTPTTEQPAASATAPEAAAFISDDSIALSLGSTTTLASNDPAVVTTTPPILSCAGGGIFFFWQLGAVKYLQENYKLEEVLLRGVSAGALVAVLLACDVNPDRAMRSAFRLSTENDIFNRPGGLAGIWGSIIRAWLEELLPEDAAERCQRVKVVATKVPALGLRYLDTFETKQDVIDACMASVHIPFFLDGNATYNLNGVQYIDGSLWDFISGDNSELLKCDGAACILDYFYDDQLQYSRLDFIKLAQFEEVKALMQSGYAWAQRTDATGGFDQTLGPVKKWAIRRWVDYPLLQIGRAIA